MIYRRIIGHRTMILLHGLRMCNLAHLYLLKIMLYVLLIKVLIPSHNTGIPICSLLSAVYAALLITFPFLYQAPFALSAFGLVFTHVHIHIHIHR